MIINAYDTLVGKPFSMIDRVKEILQQLSLMEDLLDLGNGIKLLTHENGKGIPFLNFPLTLTGYDRSIITVMDDRPYRNNKGQIVNQAERTALLTAASVQQDIMNRNHSVLLSSGALVMRAFSRSWGQQIVRTAGLTDEQAMVVYTLIGHYYNCLINDPVDDVAFSSQNLIHNNLAIPRNTIIEVLESTGYIGDLKTLHELLVNWPGMYKLKTLSLKDFIGLGQRIWYSSTGKQLIGAALEHPPLLIGMCASCISFKNSYAKTPLGMQLDPKYNEKNNRSFILTLSNSYDIQY